MNFKEKVCEQFRQLLQDKISSQQKVLLELRQSASNETKSSAGDKHETALAMLQIEQANSGSQLSELLLQKELFDKIGHKIKRVKIAQGSLIKTNQGYLFLSIALGKVSVEGTIVIALSPQSPLGSRLVGLGVNDSVEMNGKKYVVERIE